MEGEGACESVQRILVFIPLARAQGAEAFGYPAIRPHRTLHRDERARRARAVERDREAGVPAWTAIVEAAVRRFRPIVLTATAAVLAMIPLSRSVFWGPMAVAIMGGLIVATVLTLLFLPALYAAWFRVKRPVSPVAR